MLHPKVAKHTFFASTWGMIARTDHVSSHKMSLNTFQRIKNTSGIFPDRNGLKVEINSERNFGNLTNIWKWTTRSLNNLFVKKKKTSKINLREDGAQLSRVGCDISRESSRAGCRASTLICGWLWKGTGVQWERKKIVEVGQERVHPGKDPNGGGKASL